MESWAVPGLHGLLKRGGGSRVRLCKAGCPCVQDPTEMRAKEELAAREGYKPPQVCWCSKPAWIVWFLSCQHKQSQLHWRISNTSDTLQAVQCSLPARPPQTPSVPEQTKGELRTTQPHSVRAGSSSLSTSVCQVGRERPHPTLAVHQGKGGALVGMKITILPFVLTVGIVGTFTMLGHKNVGRKYCVETHKIVEQDTSRFLPVQQMHNIEPVAREAFATYLGAPLRNGTDWYFISCRFMIRTLRRLEGHKRDILVLTMEGVSGAKKMILEEEGAKLHDITVEQVRSMQPKHLNIARYINNFGKLQLWALEQYHRIAYIDADVWITKPMGEMFTYAQGFDFAAVRELTDPVSRRLDSTFNSGLMVLTPSKVRLQHMSQFINKPSYHARADQALLNAYFGWSWKELPRFLSGNHVREVGTVNNTNMVHMKFWNKLDPSNMFFHVAQVWFKALQGELPDYLKGALS